MTFLMFFCALALSTSAAWYSIIGLTAIFAAAKIPIIIMGATLEISKLVVASWLYRNWKEIPFLMKTYLTGALLVLMFLTSMGIFGFLSKSHADQSMNSGDVIAQIEMLEQRIQIEQSKIDSAKTTLAQLDAQVNEMIGRSTSTSAINRSITIRKQQDKERSVLIQSIEESQSRINELREELIPYKTQNRQLEAEVGPIKYIAALIYGENPDENLLEKAIRWVILLIVGVFDPLAVVMLIAANWSMRHRSESVSVSESGLGLVQSIPQPISNLKPKPNTVSNLEDSRIFNGFVQRTIITNDVNLVKSNLSKEFGLPIEEPKLEIPKAKQESMLEEPKVEETRVEQLELEEQEIEQNAELVTKLDGAPEPIFDSERTTKFNQESSNTTQNEPEDAGDFWRSRPHRPITRR
jgi:hypothetical protein